MATETQVAKIRIYDNEDYRTFSFSTQLVGTGDEAGLSGPLNTLSIVPGSINDEDTYVRTDVSGYPQEIQNLTATCWTEAAYTAHEAALRA